MTLRDLLQTIVDEVSNLDTEIVITYETDSEWHYKTIDFATALERDLSDDGVFEKLGDSVKTDSIIVFE